MPATITLLQAPHTTFYSKADLEEFGDEAVATERAIAAFRADRNQAALWSDLRALGWPDDEIEAVIANPKAALVCGYGWLTGHCADG
jgi:hypothetical protein